MDLLWTVNNKPGLELRSSAATWAFGRGSPYARLSEARTELTNLGAKRQLGQ